MDAGRAGTPGGAGCARRSRALAALLVLALLPCAAGSGGRVAGAAAASAAATPADTARAPQYFPPLQRPPLDPPLRLTASFGEYRSGHFHAGLDFSTGERVGQPVYASLPGYVVRVRASGVGYGRSVYVQADDGRLLVYGHLDAFDEPLAAYVDSVQVASAGYEQDLWPEPPVAGGPARFRVSPGQRLGWSGRSGTGDPHLHFEIRRGDVAYNPLLAGLALADTVAPVIRRVALEPLGPGGCVEDAAAARTLVCTGRDTVRLRGAARVIVEALDARGDGEFTMAPWRITLEGDGPEVECRFDSVSWAEGMTEVDYVYDRGRAAPEVRRALRLWAPAGFRPRVLRVDVPADRAGGAIEMPPEAGSPREIRLRAEDAAGQAAAETLVVEPGTCTGEERSRPGEMIPAQRPSSGGVPGFAWSMEAGVLFEDSRIATTDAGRPVAPPELKACGHAFAMMPALTPLRRPLRVGIGLAKGEEARGVALYRDSGDGWEWLGAEGDSGTGRIGAESRRLGRFALFRDVRPPRVTVPAAPPAPLPGAYPRWALEVRVEEQGSGVDARRSLFVVDGRRVPSEWDAVAGTLRWRPLRAPASGRHEVEVCVADRAGNVRRRHGSFVLD